MQLYLIANEYQQALDAFINSPDMDNDTALGELKVSFEEKSIAVAKYIRNLEVEKAAIQEAIEAMANRAKSLGKRAENLRGYLHFHIEQTGLIDKIKCPEFEIYRQLNPPKLVIEDEAIIPELYFKEKIVKDIDKVALKKDIQSGFDVEGAKVVQESRLVIK